MSTRRDELQRRARALRNVTEPIAAGVYFAPEAHQGYEAQGLDYFEGYFCSRSACLGAAPWSVVCAAFAAFKPAAVESSVTNGWAKTTPAPDARGTRGRRHRAARAARRTDRRTRPTSTARPRSSSPRTDGVDPVRPGAVRRALDPRPADDAVRRAVAVRRPRPRAPRRRPHRGVDAPRRLHRDHRDDRARVGHPAALVRVHPRVERGRGRRRVRAAHRARPRRRRRAHRRRHGAAGATSSAPPTSPRAR